MVKQTMWLLDRHLIESSRPSVDVFKRKETRFFFVCLTIIELATVFAFSYVAYLLVFDQVAILLGQVTRDFQSFPLFALDATFFHRAVTHHLAAGVVATLWPIPRLVYDVWVDWFCDGYVTIAKNAWPPRNPRVFGAE